MIFKAVWFMIKLCILKLEEFSCFSWHTQGNRWSHVARPIYMPAAYRLFHL